MAEYLHCSMYGSYWIDCFILDEVPNVGQWILYFDPWIEEYEIALVIENRLRTQ